MTIYLFPLYFLGYTDVGTDSVADVGLARVPHIPSGLRGCESQAQSRLRACPFHETPWSSAQGLCTAGWPSL